MRQLTRRALLIAPCLKLMGNDIQLVDAPVTTHEGQRSTIRRLSAGQTVALQFMFTSCTTVCPLLGNLFAQVQRLLKARGRSNVLLLSVSVDPEHDTPSRLKAFLRQHDAQPGWIAVRVPDPYLNVLLRGIGEAVGSPSLHSPQVMIFDASGRCVERFRELTPAERIADGLLAASA